MASDQFLRGMGCTHLGGCGWSRPLGERTRKSGRRVTRTDMRRAQRLASWNFDPNYGVTVNLYGFTACPKCDGRHRFSLVRRPQEVVCDDCGLVEPVVSRERE